MNMMVIKTYIEEEELIEETTKKTTTSERKTESQENKNDEDKQFHNVDVCKYIYILIICKIIAKYINLQDR